ncbi:hypothetical protein ACFX16_043337 [Malus domestica]
MAANPLTCGHDMDVPERMLKLTRMVSSSSLVGPTAPVHPARMFTPGAIRSGLSTLGETGFGPLELNAATTGEGSTPNCVFPKAKCAFGSAWEAIYLFIALPALWPTIIVASRCTSAISSSPLISASAKIIPTPPALLTTAPFSTSGFSP